MGNGLRRAVLSSFPPGAHPRAAKRRRSEFYRGIRVLLVGPRNEEREFERIPRLREEVKDEEAGFAVSEIRTHPESCKEWPDELNHDDFVFKKQFHAARNFIKTDLQRKIWRMAGCVIFWVHEYVIHHIFILNRIK